MTCRLNEFSSTLDTKKIYSACRLNGSSSTLDKIKIYDM